MNELVLELREQVAKLKERVAELEAWRAARGASDRRFVAGLRELEREGEQRGKEWARLEQERGKRA
jgi:hypothetical protein